MLSNENTSYSLIGKIIANTYQIKKKLASGGYGDVYQGINLKTNVDVAIKLELEFLKKPRLFKEAEVYEKLLEDPAIAKKGIANIYYTGSFGVFNVLVMDLLGLNLEQLFIECKKKFSLKTVLMLADQILELIELMHKKKYLHRDIKPNNFLVGSGKSFRKIFLIDFGLSKCFIQKNEKHIPYNEESNIKGTLQYASIWSHSYMEKGRRDDLESIGYMLIYLLRGSLPWQNLNDSLEIKEKKIETIQNLGDGFPYEFTEFLRYSRSLIFDQEPDYLYLKKLFQDLFVRSGFEMDYIYDWSNNRESQNKEL